ncbi:hypothetical protein A2U01_0067873, partial [Trifolium medium]|nr:hypothetical protein [Trifolium medium]
MVVEVEDSPCLPRFRKWWSTRHFKRKSSSYRFKVTQLTTEERNLRKKLMDYFDSFVLEEIEDLGDPE